MAKIINLSDARFKKRMNDVTAAVRAKADAKRKEAAQKKLRRVMDSAVSLFLHAEAAEAALLRGDK